MAGKPIAIVTGGSSGIGAETVRQLLDKGYYVVNAVRNIRKAEIVMQQLMRKSMTQGKNVTTWQFELMLLNLDSLHSVYRFYHAFVTKYGRLNVLVNNAGIANQNYRLSVDGYEEMFAVNFLGQFYLAMLMLPVLQASSHEFPPARIVIVGSEGHKMAKGTTALTEEYVRRAGVGYTYPATQALKNYGRTKLCVILYALELARRVQGSGVTVNTMDPGTTGSNLGELDKRTGVQAVAARAFQSIARPPEKSARMPVWLASSTQAARLNGQYVIDFTIRQTAENVNPENQELLWNYSIEHIRRVVGDALMPQVPPAPIRPPLPWETAATTPATALWGGAVPLMSTGSHTISIGSGPPPAAYPLYSGQAYMQ